MKVKVIENCTLACLKGSIVEIDELQYKYAKKYVEIIANEEKKADKQEKKTTKNKEK